MTLSTSQGPWDSCPESLGCKTVKVTLRGERKIKIKLSSAGYVEFREGKNQHSTCIDKICTYLDKLVQKNSNQKLLDSILLLTVLLIEKVQVVNFLQISDSVSPHHYH